MKGEIFLAWRYLKPQKSAISLLTYISLLGPTLGVGILVVVISVMNGMPKEMEKKLLAYSSHITVSDYKPINNAKKVSSYIETNYDVKVSPVSICPVLLQKNNGDIEVLITKGVLPKYDSNVSQLKTMLVKKSETDLYELSSKQIIVSQSIADSLNIDLGDKILLHSPEKYKASLDLNSDSATSAEFEVINFFSTGISDIDNQFIIANLIATNDLINLQEQQAQILEISIPDPKKAEDIAIKMSNDDFLKSYQITPWQQQHNIKNLYRMIENQTSLMMFVLFFIVIGAALGVAACLFSMVIQKTQEIGILKATGVTPASIIFVFICQGTILGSIGAGLGLIGGFITLAYRKEVANTFGFWDATLYRLESVPAYYDLSDITIISLGTIIICTLASFIPALIAASVNPVKALQSQG